MLQYLEALNQFIDTRWEKSNSLNQSWSQIYCENLHPNTCGKRKQYYIPYCDMKIPLTYEESTPEIQIPKAPNRASRQELEVQLLYTKQPFESENHSFITLMVARCVRFFSLCTPQYDIHGPLYLKSRLKFSNNG